jgi:predicted  nucleic acid-binding Zn ribbon protein
MYSIELSFKPLAARDDRAADDAISTLLATFRMNGQVLGREWCVSFDGKSYRTVVMTPESSSLSSRFANKHVRRAMQQLAAKGLRRPEMLMRGRELESQTSLRKVGARSYILFTTYLALESPIKSSDGFRPVPLYRLPSTYDDEYNDIISWQSDYQACDALQMGCATGERFGTREISDINSSLTKRGLEICSKLGRLVHRPFYYYLYRGTGRSLSAELRRKCPGCGNSHWRLERPMHTVFDFKCDKCKLLSNIALEFRTR